MLLKQLALPGLCCILFSAGAQAAPLTSFDEYNGSLDLGMWRTDVAITGSELANHDLDTNMNFPAKWRLYGGITFGINDRWGLQYMYHGMASGAQYRADDEDKEESGIYKGNSQELNLIYSLDKGSNIAMFIGANRVHNEIWYSDEGYPGGTDEGTRTHFQAGLVGKAPLGDNVNLYGLVGFGSHDLFQAETGLAFKMKNNWEANVGYRWFRVNDAFDEYKNGYRSGSFDEPWGKVKVKGLQFGITHYFGHSKPKEEVIPPYEPPVVVQPPVVEPPVEQPLKIILKGVNFDFDRDTLLTEAYPVLNNVVDVANRHPQWNFVLVGHTDSMGSDEYNMELSMRRVKTVQRYLTSKGVAEKRLDVDWKGEREPIATNETAEGRAENRRVELHIK